MSKTVIGLIVAAVLAITAIYHGFGGFLLMAVFLAIGGVVGHLLETENLNLEEAWNSLFKKGSSSR